MASNSAKLTLAAVLLSASIFLFRLEFARAKPHPRQQAAECEVTPPTRAIVDNDAPGKVAADPAKTIADGKALYAQIETYRTSHQGRYPTPAAAKPHDSFSHVATRPDGTALGGTKPHGTRDILAFSTRYYQLNSHHMKAGGDTIDPAGFFIVVWDNGAVDEVPYADLMFVKQPGGKYVWGFRGQAGVPADAIPFDAFYKTYPRVS